MDGQTGERIDGLTQVQIWLIPWLIFQSVKILLRFNMYANLELVSRVLLRSSGSAHLAELLADFIDVNQCSR